MESTTTATKGHEMDSTNPQPTAAAVRASLREDWTGLPTFAATQRASQPQPTAAAVRASLRDDWTTGADEDDGLSDAERAILDDAAGADFSDVEDGAREAFAAIQAKRDAAQDTPRAGDNTERCGRCGEYVRDCPTDALCWDCFNSAPFVVVATNGGEDGTLYAVVPSDAIPSASGGWTTRSDAEAERDYWNNAAGTTDSAAAAQARYDAVRATQSAADDAAGRAFRLALARKCPALFTDGDAVTDAQVQKAEAVAAERAKLADETKRAADEANDGRDWTTTDDGTAVRAWTTPDDTTPDDDDAPRPDWYDLDPCDCGTVRGASGGFVDHAAGGHADCTAFAVDEDDDVMDCGCSSGSCYCDDYVVEAKREADANWRDDYSGDADNV